jgi:hypothetical protein
MGSNSTVIIIQPILQQNNVAKLDDLVYEPVLFCKVFMGILSLMRKTLLTTTEDQFPLSTLEVIRDDLFKLTQALSNYSGVELEGQVEYPDTYIGYLYSLDSLNNHINASRTEIMKAIGVKKSSSPTRSRGIQNCRNKVFQAMDMVRDFEQQKP